MMFFGKGVKYMSIIKYYKVYTTRDRRANSNKLLSTFQNRNLAQQYADALWNDLPHTGEKTGACVVVEPVITV